MTIREYFEQMITEGTDWEEVAEISHTLYECSQDDWEDFAMWAIENGIDLDARDEETNELVVTLWQWDECGD